MVPGGSGLWQNRVRQLNLDTRKLASKETEILPVSVSFSSGLLATDNYWFSFLFFTCLLAFQGLNVAGTD